MKLQSTWQENAMLCMNWSNDSKLSDRTIAQRRSLVGLDHQLLKIAVALVSAKARTIRKFLSKSTARYLKVTLVKCAYPTERICTAFGSTLTGPPLSAVETPFPRILLLIRGWKICFNPPYLMCLYYKPVV